MIYLEEQLPIKYCEVKHLMLLTKYDGYQRGLVAMVYKTFDKKSYGGNASGGAIEDYVKPIINWRITKTNY